jgi:hypothetical protein
MARRRSPRALRWVTGAATIASVLLAWGPGALGVSAANGRLLGAHAWFLPLIVLSLVLGALLDVSLPVGRSRWQVRGLDLVGAGLLFLCPGPGLWVATVIAAAGLAVGARRLPGRRWRSMEYASGSALLQMAAAVAVTDLLRWADGPAVAAAAGGLLVAAIIRHVMSAAGVALTAGRPVVSLLLPRLPAALLTAGGNGAVGLLVGWLLVNAPVGLAGLVVPGLVVASTYEVQARRGAEARLFAALATEQQRVAGGSLDQSVTVLMTVVARIFGGADVELLLSGPEGLVRYTGDERGQLEGVAGRVRTDLHALDAAWVRRLLASGSVLIGSDEGRPSCAFFVGSGHSPRALAIARRPLGGAAFSRRDIVFARALARQAAAWLAPVTDSGPARDPRLELVRDISRRILASPEPAHDPQWSSLLLDEVHALERAVAALLGSAPGGSIPPQRDRRAAGAASSGELAVADETDSKLAAGTLACPAPRRAADEWTTTGKLA